MSLYMPGKFIRKNKLNYSLLVANHTSRSSLDLCMFMGYEIMKEDEHLLLFTGHHPLTLLSDPSRILMSWATYSGIEAAQKKEFLPLLFIYAPQAP